MATGRRRKRLEGIKITRPGLRFTAWVSLPFAELPRRIQARRRGIGISKTISVDLTGLPLASSLSTMRGSATAPMRFDIGLFDGELPANVEWTLRPIE